MKVRIVTVFAGLIVALGLTLASGIPAASPSSAVPARCPNIHHAVEALQSAKGDLERAGHDFCGHKVEAIEATNHALEQLRKAEECDRCR